MSAHTIVTLTGASCSGKTTLAKALGEAGMATIRSFTTRPIRTGEVDGVDYDFRSKLWVSEQAAKGRLIECNRFNGCLYGISVDNVEEAMRRGNVLLKIVDPNGARALRHWANGRFQVYAILLDAPVQVLTQRLLQRSAPDMAANSAYYAARLKTLIEEEASWSQPENWPGYDAVYDNVLPGDLGWIAGRILKDLLPSSSATSLMAA
ncbi:MAG: hypothetical protein E6Q76_08205 [Rhizobium sp.]|nr:MAG: hypothetical protein E6Q76_08205 [Rhizobium sp.]